MTMSSEANLKKKKKKGRGTQSNHKLLQDLTNAPTVKIQLVAGTVRDKKKELG